jgi:hypothetical protein
MVAVWLVTGACAAWLILGGRRDGELPVRNCAVHEESRRRTERSIRAFVEILGGIAASVIQDDP